jgi:hypothetical protein
VTDYLTVVEAPAIHDDQIQRYGGSAAARARRWASCRAIRRVTPLVATSQRNHPPVQFRRHIFEK